MRGLVLQQLQAEELLGQFLGQMEPEKRIETAGGPGIWYSSSLSLLFGELSLHSSQRLSRTTAGPRPPAVHPHSHKGQDGVTDGWSREKGPLSGILFLFLVFAHSICLADVEVRRRNFERKHARVIRILTWSTDFARCWCPPAGRSRANKNPRSHFLTCCRPCPL